MEALIANIVVAVVTHAPEFVEKVLAIHKSSSLSPEQKEAAYAALKAEYASTVEKVKAAEL